MTKIMKYAMRAAMVVACAAALIAAPAMAQGGGGGGMGGGGGRGMNTQAQVDAMTTALTLTPDQQTSIKAILDAGMKDNMAMRADTTLSDDDRRTKMMAMRTAQTAKIKAVLTDDQKPKYDAMLAAQRQRGPGGGGGGTPPPPPPAV